MIGLLNSTGDLVARYVYDAWGRPLSVTDGKGRDVTGDPSHIANRNPLRYRGYYCDQETSFYYLQSRYYDPVLCRFVNADSFASTGQAFLGYNMYAYCNNCPVNMRDGEGGFPTYATMLSDTGYHTPNDPDDLNETGSRGNNTFSASSSTTTTIAKTKTAIIPDPSPITIETGTQTTRMVIHRNLFLFMPTVMLSTRSNLRQLALKLIFLILP